ncbi:MAG: DEAD/DEAH box helicase [Candidatus Micrarchaeota archaeon]
MPTVVELVRERFGDLTSIQKLAMPRVMAGENVLILAPTGSGKTESALLPVLEKIKEMEAAGSGEGIIALYITPLRALSRDLKERFSWWCDRLRISHDIRTGDTTLAERAKHRKNPPKILLTTVESLQALLLGRVMRKHLSSVRFVIVDEIHDILDNKRGAQLSMGLERLAIIAKFQRIGLTATVADEGEAAKLLFGEREHAVCESGKNRPIEVTVESLPQEKRLERMKALAAGYRSLIFVNTRSTAEELGASLKKIGAPIGVHHGSLAKEVRLATEDEFKSGKLNSILCTSSLELGIDIGDVSLVMQYGSPHQVFRLIQRVGRSGHSLGKTPRGIVLSSDFDDMLEGEVITILAKNGWIEGKKAERGALDVIAHQLAGLVLDLGRSDLRKLHGVLSGSYAYGITYDKLRMVALQLYSEGILYYDESGETVMVRAKPRARAYYSSYLSTIPKTKRFLLRDVTSNRIISSLDEDFVVGLDTGSGFLSHGMPWQVIDITDKEVLAGPSAATDMMVPSWTGEDIPVAFEVAQEVGLMRKMKKDVHPIPDDRTVVLEVIDDTVVLHCCCGTRVNEAIARIFSKKLSMLIGETVISVADPYRVMLKLPFPLKAEDIARCFRELRDVRSALSEALEDSPLLRFKFTHVGRMFGLLAEEANVSTRFIRMLRHSVVYEEAMRSIFFRYFDVPKTQEVLESIRAGRLAFIVDSRKTPSYFAKIGLERVSGAEAVGAFEPRERMVAAFKESALSKTLRLRCMNCGAERFLHLAGAPEKIACHKCSQFSLALLGKDGEDRQDMNFSAGLIAAYGKRALIALSTYGIGPQTADRLLKRLHRDEQAFYLDLIAAQKNFVKNKKYWKL